MKAGCPVDGCAEEMRLRRLMCRTHWAMIDRALRFRLIGLWREGPVSPAFPRTLEAAIRQVEAQTGDPHGR